MWHKLLISCFLVSGLSGCAGWDRIQYKNGKARGEGIYQNVRQGAEISPYNAGLLLGITGRLVRGGYNLDPYVEKFEK